MRLSPQHPTPRNCSRHPAPLTLCLSLIVSLTFGQITPPQLAAAASAPPIIRLQWPTREPTPIIKPFDKPAQNWLPGHRGVDLGSTAELVAPAPGIVRFAGMLAGREVISIDHGNGYITSFEPVTPTVKRGDTVTAGQIIGRPWSPERTQHCGPTPCYHLGLRYNGEYLNPLLYLTTSAQAVRLLPWAT